MNNQNESINFTIINGLYLSDDNTLFYDFDQQPFPTSHQARPLILFYKNGYYYYMKFRSYKNDDPRYDEILIKPRNKALDHESYIDFSKIYKIDENDLKKIVDSSKTDKYSNDKLDDYNIEKIKEGLKERMLKPNVPPRFTISNISYDDSTKQTKSDLTYISKGVIDCINKDNKYEFIENNIEHVCDVNCNKAFNNLLIKSKKNNLVSNSIADIDYIENFKLMLDFSEEFFIQCYHDELQRFHEEQGIDGVDRTPKKDKGSFTR